MSDLAKAREFLATARHCLEIAESMMTREPPIKRARAKTVRITKAIREQVETLSKEGKSNHEIAELTGLRNGGRVSEILTGETMSQKNMTGVLLFSKNGHPEIQGHLTIDGTAFQIAGFFVSPIRASISLWLIDHDGPGQNGDDHEYGRGSEAERNQA